MLMLNIFNEEYIRIAKAPIIRPKFKLELLDYNDNVIGEIIDDISTDSAGSISINYQQGVRRSCSITFHDPEGKFVPDSNSGLFWINRKFKLYVGLEHTGYHFSEEPILYGNYEDYLNYSRADDQFFVYGRPIMGEDSTYWFSQGVFYVVDPDTSRSFSNQTVTINGVDKFGIFGPELGANQLEGTYKIPSGTNAYDAIRGILMLEAGNGYVLDPVTPIFDEQYKEVVLPYEIQKAPSAYLSDLLIEIADVLGCDIFYDGNGVLNVRSGTIDLSYSNRSPIWDFSDVLREYLDGGLAYDYVNAINVVKVIGGNVNDKIYPATAENNNPLSPTRISLIGKKTYYVENSNISNEKQAQDFADYTLNTKSIVQLMINFNCTFLPHLDVDKVITVSDKFYNYDQQRFIIQSVNIPLSANSAMSVQASNIATLPYYELQNGGK